MNNYDTMEFKKYTSKSEIQKALNTLKGIIEGISLDNTCNNIELDELEAWCFNMKFLEDKKPFNELIPLINDSLQDNYLSQEEIKDILWVCNKFLEKNNYYDNVTSGLQKLQGIFHGILSDNNIEDKEIIQLENWLNDNDYLSGFYPYDEISTLITSILSDGIITNDEVNILKVFFSEFIDSSIDSNINFKEIEILKNDYTVEGICATSPKIEFEDKLFCFTGASNKTTRDGFNNIITSLKGQFRNNISSKTDYLIIGGAGNPCWAYSCYGRKVEQALTLRKKGKKVIIIHENDFWSTIENLSN
jgi:BRCA1 C Terminus (BRCT) domain